MKLRTLTIWSLLLISFMQVKSVDPPPVIGLCLAAPRADRLDQFISFMEKELAPGGINTLVLRVDYNYAFLSHPNLRDENPLTEKDVKRLVSTAQALGISIIPQVNLLGHQSWHSTMENLLTVSFASLLCQSTSESSWLLSKHGDHPEI